jgi:hypothetical protein
MFSFLSGSGLGGFELVEGGDQCVDRDAPGGDKLSTALP